MGGRVTPDYSVVIPAFNAAPTIAEAIESIRGQTLAAAAVIVVDDGSVDDTAAIAETLGARVIRQANAGPGAATTAGLALVDTPLVATLDADDLFLPAKMERQVTALMAAPDLSGVFARMTKFAGDPTAADLDTSYDAWTRSTLVMRTDAARRGGPLVDQPALAGEVIDWIARLREAGHRFELLPEVLGLRRIRPGSLTFGRNAQDLTGYLHLSRAAILRKRARSGS